MKTITAWEIKAGDQIRIKNPNDGKTYEMTVDWIKKYTDESTVSVWGSWVIDNVGASQAVTLVGEELI